MLPRSGYSTGYYAQNNSCVYEIMLANEILTALPVPASLVSGKWWETKDAGNQRRRMTEQDTIKHMRGFIYQILVKILMEIIKKQKQTKQNKNKVTKKKKI